MANPHLDIRIATPMPPVGPLKSTENLLPGDILRVLDSGNFFPFPSGKLLTFLEVRHGEIVVEQFPASRMHFRFAFVARPGVWMPWSGGDNPVPGMKVRTKGACGDHDAVTPSDDLIWAHHTGRTVDITAYMVVTDEAPAKGDPVEPPFGCTGEAWKTPAAEHKFISLDDAQIGDRVLVTIETLVTKPVSASRPLLFSEQEAASARVELLYRPEKPLAVGDRVRLMNGADEGLILAFTSDGRAVVEYEAGDTTNVMSRDTSCLTRI